MVGISIEEILNDSNSNLELELIAGEEGLKKKIVATDVNRPGLALTGYLKYFEYKRVQVFGKTEMSYIESFSLGKRKILFNKLFSYKILAIITWSQEIPNDLVKIAIKNKTIILRTSLPTNKFATRLAIYLEDKLAPSTSIHGGLLDVFGVGIMILGKSGAGKSECALELIERGHRLIADDIVDIKRTASNALIGYGAELIKHHMEIRGLGIINIKNLFGIGAIESSKKIDLVVNLEEWSATKEYDRLGLEEPTISILGIKIPQILLPIRPGRNIAVIIEVAAMNHRLKEMGYHSAEEFNKELLNWIQDSSQKTKT
ncbi:HPr(Ser) kinase/phosphatase [bacterium]|nr:HPr(Ser) kinase/phosphatase [bacterium]MBU0899856.1 HPr(Ser) kinase/phosphatase [bacterium]MBU1153636.1 HPr(Ser) kinase/phosphatase [bacterium]MBU2599431.1 HPr(Ser) kinase/phosphatase [bacterium]